MAEQPKHMYEVMVYHVVGCCLDGQMLMAYTILLPQKWTSRAPGTPET